MEMEYILSTLYDEKRNVREKKRILNHLELSICVNVTFMAASERATEQQVEIYFLVNYIQNVNTYNR